MMQFLAHAVSTHLIQQNRFDAAVETSSKSLKLLTFKAKMLYSYIRSWTVWVLFTASLGTKTLQRYLKQTADTLQVPLGAFGCSTALMEGNAFLHISLPRNPIHLASVVCHWYRKLLCKRSIDSDTNKSCHPCLKTSDSKCPKFEGLKVPDNLPRNILNLFKLQRTSTLSQEKS